MYDQVLFITAIAVPLAMVFAAGIVFLMDRFSATLPATEQFIVYRWPEDDAIPDMERVRAIRNQLRSAAQNPGRRTVEQAVMEEWQALSIDEDTAIAIRTLAAHDKTPGFTEAIERAFAET